MAGEIAYRLTADEKQAMDAVRRLAESMAGAEKSVKGVTDETKRLRKKQESMGRYARRAFEEAQSPAEKYTQQIKTLDDLLKKGKITQDEWTAASKKAADAMEEAGKKGKEAFGPEALERAKGFLGALGIETGIAGAVKLIKDEWEAVIKVQERALEASVPVADAQRKMRGAAGFANIEQAEVVDQQIEEISKQLGVTAKDLYLDAAAAMKDRHGLSREQALGAVATAAEMFPADAEGRRQFTQAMLGVQQATGMSGRQAGGWLMAGEQRSGMGAGELAPILNALPDQNPQQVLALAQAMGTATGASPTRGVQAIMQGLSKGVATKTSGGDYGREGTIKKRRVRRRGIPSALGRDNPRAANPRRGRTSGRDSSARRPRSPPLVRMRPKRSRMAGLRQGFQQRGVALHAKETESAGETFDEQLAFIQAHPESIDEIVKGIRGPAGRTAARQILTGQGPAFELYRKALASGIKPAEAEAVLARQRGVMGAGPLQTTAAFNRGLNVTQESIERPRLKCSHKRGSPPCLSITARSCKTSEDRSSFPI